MYDRNTAAPQHRRTGIRSELLFRILRCLNFARAQPPSQKSQETPVTGILNSLAALWVYLYLIASNLKETGE